jgi:hypothetical protein
VAIAQRARVAATFKGLREDRREISAQIPIGRQQRNGDRRQRVAQRPGIDVTVRPVRESGDGRKEIARRQRSIHRKPLTSQQKIQFDEMRVLMQNRLPFVEISQSRYRTRSVPALFVGESNSKTATSCSSGR